MHLVIYIIVLLMGVPLLASGCCPAGDKPASLTSERKEIVVRLARDFGIEKIESIIKPFSMMGRYLDVRGDEQLVGNIGRYKQLSVFLMDESFVFESPRPPTLDDCTLRIIEFVELEVMGSKKRVLTDHMSPELALKLLAKIFNSEKLTLAPGFDDKDLPSRELMSEPAHLTLSPFQKSDSVLYELGLMSHHNLSFTVEKENIVIQEFSWHIH